MFTALPFLQDLWQQLPHLWDKQLLPVPLSFSYSNQFAMKRIFLRSVLTNCLYSSIPATLCQYKEINNCKQAINSHKIKSIIGTITQHNMTNIAYQYIQ